MSTSPPVVIVGGGLAGLAAAVGLSLHGVKCRVLESRQKLGGRASSFIDPTNGEELDNCQHVSMGCCTNFAHFMQTIGAERLFRREMSLTFIGTSGRSTVMKAAPLPAPLHLFPSMASLNWLSLSERMRLLLGLSSLLRTPSSQLRGVRLSDWLEQHHQTPRICSGFWHLVLVSALSESLDRIDASYARKVLLDGFARNRTGWEVLVPTESLTRLNDEIASEFLTRRGVIIERSAQVENLTLEQQLVSGITTRTGEEIPVEDVIVAIPPYRLAPLLEASGIDQSGWPDLSKIETAPIASVHLWFDRPLTTMPNAVLVDRMSQWMFNRSTGVTQPGEPWYCQVVISASRDIESIDQNAIVNQVADELRETWPEARDAQLLRGRLVVERRAVFSVTPGIDQLRPAQQSPIRNLQLAGDWTQTGWPATMEGAVRSGYLAAENVLRRRGIKATVLQPDLPSVWLSRLAFPE
ncbi:MAG: hydroxysqualene dehydroxylase HpnE [Planctomycetaceae bacterium]